MKLNLRVDDSTEYSNSPGGQVKYKATVTAPQGVYLGLRLLIGTSDQEQFEKLREGKTTVGVEFETVSREWRVGDYWIAPVVEPGGEGFFMLYKVDSVGSDGYARLLPMYPHRQRFTVGQKDIPDHWQHVKL